MAPVVIDVRQADDPRDVVHRAAEAIAAGQVVAFPTETVYGLAASALNAEAVEHLLQLNGPDAGDPLALAIKSADDALDYVPDLSVLGRRLARRCWPGPVTLVLDDSHPESVVRRLPESVQRAVVPNGTIGLRVPAHPLVQAVLRVSAGPLALTSVNRNSESDAVSGADVVDALGDKVPLVLDDGESRYAQASSVVQIKDNELMILREGVVGEPMLRRLSGPMVLFVCTGNTCRSPMAEALMRKRVAAKLGCDDDQVEERGVVIASAGIAAMRGGRSSGEAVDVMREFDLDVTQHESQPLSEQLVQYADLILTMTRGHRDAVLAQWPAAQDRTFLLCHDQVDVSDPIGGPVTVYRRCAEQIDEQLEDWLNKLDIQAGD